MKSVFFDGFYNISSDDLDDMLEVPLVGDEAIITFDNCIDFPGVVINGTVDVVFNTVDGIPPTNFELGIDMFFDIDASGGGEKATIDGDISAVLSNGDGFNYIALFGSELIINNGQASEESLSDYLFWEKEEIDSGAWQAFIGGTYSSASTGSWDVETTTDFIGIGDAPPDEGVLDMSGAAGSWIILDADNGNPETFELRHDVEEPIGEEDPGSPQTVLWSNFLSPIPGSAPIISDITPSSGNPGAMVTIHGSNFGSTQGSSAVRFHNGVIATNVQSWSSTSIEVEVPEGFFNRACYGNDNKWFK